MVRPLADRRGPHIGRGMRMMNSSNNRALGFGVNLFDGTITDGGELTHAYAAEGEVKMTKQEIIEMIQRAGFEAVERNTVYNRVASV